MSNFFNRFYFFSKFSTSLILFAILIVLSYIFIKAYFQINATNNISSDKIDLSLYQLSDLIEKNSSNINDVKNLVINNKKSVENIDVSIAKIEENKLFKEVKIQLQKLSEENKALGIQLSSLLPKIENLNSTEQSKIKDEDPFKLSLNNYIYLIKLKLDSGLDYIEEVKLLQGLPLNLEQISYIDKLSILTNTKFFGLTRLNNNFDLLSAKYLNAYYLNKNNNNFIKYFLNFVTIQPNISEIFKDKNIQSLSLAKQRLLENNLEKSIYQLTLINGYDIFFESWIEQAKHYIEVNNILDKILK